MSVTVSPMGHSYCLVEDFLSLDHWAPYGSGSDRDVALRPGASVEGGNALSISGSGALRVARETDIIPGEPITVSYWAFRETPGRGPASVRLLPEDGTSGWESLVISNNNDLITGWNRIIVQTTPPADWHAVRLALFENATNPNPGGMVARFRAIPTSAQEAT